MARPTSLLLALSVLLASAGLSTCSQYEPHPPGSAPSSFEGWYIRAVAHDATAASGPPPVSWALIVAAMPHAPPGNATYMASLIVQDGSLPNTRQPTVYSRSGMRLTITTGGGHPVTTDPSISSPPRFQLESADGSLLLSMSGQRCQLHARYEGACLIASCTGPPHPWSASGLGPEGTVAGVPAALTGLHWFVHSLATPLRFTLCQASVPELRGRAMAHFEKNWGRSFPSAWTWAQGLNLSTPTPPDPASSSSEGGSAGMEQAPPFQAAFALAGGKLPSPLVPESWIPNLWLLGVRTGNYSWDFHPWDSIFTVHPSPCASRSTLLLTATQPLTRRGVEVQIEAQRDSFAEVECPTRQGFRPYSDESFAATATVRLFQYQVGRNGQSWIHHRLLEAFEFSGVALEFGGEARCHQAGLQREPQAAVAIA